MFSWACAQQIKALAATADIKITNHAAFFSFLKEVSTDLNNEYFYSEFLKMNDLHRNFYDEFILNDTFETVFHEAMKFLKQLSDLTEERIQLRARDQNQIDYPTRAPSG